MKKTKKLSAVKNHRKTTAQRKQNNVQNAQKPKSQRARIFIFKFVFKCIEILGTILGAIQLIKNFFLNMNG
jgi:hypothetical protein